MVAIMRRGPPETPKTPNAYDLVDWINNGSPAVTKSAGVNLNNGKLANVFKYIKITLNQAAPPTTPL